MRWLAIALCAFACGGSGDFFRDPSDLSLQPETHYSSYWSGFDQPARLVIRDQGTWATFWQRMHSSVTPQPAVPTVDFASRMVVAAAMGTRNSGGYSIVVASMSTGADATANVVSTSPGTNCVVTGALTQPLDAAVVPRVEGTVKFVESTKVHDC